MITGRTDWTALRALSDEEIERLAEADADNPPTDERYWEGATVYVPPQLVPPPPGGSRE